MKRHVAGAVLLAYFVAAFPFSAGAENAVGVVESATPAIRNDAPPADAIPGYYNPARGTFKPLAIGPAAAAANFYMQARIRLTFRFETSSPLDYPTISCQAHIRTEKSQDSSSTDKSADGSKDFDPSTEAGGVIPLFYALRTTETAPKVKITIQCDATDVNGKHAYVTLEQVVPVKTGTIDVPFPVTFL